MSAIKCNQIENITGTTTVAVDDIVDVNSLRTELNASGSAPIYACRAWVNFNGTGTVAIRASGNVSSITDNGTGDYTINFITAMIDTNYSVGGTCGIVGGTGRVANTIKTNFAYLVGGTRVNTVTTYESSSALSDMTYANINILR